MITVQFTPEQLERLTVILSCHLDLNIDPRIQKVMKTGNIKRTKELMDMKDQDSAILQILYEADRAAGK